MRRATTPTHTFTFPETLSTYSEIEVTYKQGKVVLTKHKADMTPGDTTKKGVITWTQEETMMFDHGRIELQIRAKVGNGVMGTAITSILLYDTLSEVIL